MRNVNDCTKFQEDLNNVYDWAADYHRFYQKTFFNQSFRVQKFIRAVKSYGCVGQISLLVFCDRAANKCMQTGVESNAFQISSNSKSKNSNFKFQISSNSNSKNSYRLSIKISGNVY